MSKLTKNSILKATSELFSGQDQKSFSIRNLATKLDVVPSVIYYHFKDEKELLFSMYKHLTHELGALRKELPKTNTAKKMLKQRIAFQIDHQAEIVAVLKYYLAFRHSFPEQKSGFIPDKSSLHIVEVLEFGKKNNEFKVKNVADDAKVITHAINGFLLEYHPYIPTGTEKNRLVKRIYSFLIRALVPL